MPEETARPCQGELLSKTQQAILLKRREEHLQKQNSGHSGKERADPGLLRANQIIIDENPHKRRDDETGNYQQQCAKKRIDEGGAALLQACTEKPQGAGSAAPFPEFRSRLKSQNHAGITVVEFVGMDFSAASGWVVDVEDSAVSANTIQNDKVIK